MGRSKLINVLIIVAVFAVLGGVLYGVMFRNTDNKSSENKSQEKSQATITPNPQSKVEVTKDGFGPNRIEVDVGTRVIWMNKSGGNVAINSDDYPSHTKYVQLNLGEFADGSSVQLVFDKAGTYSYHNHLKPTQKGVVVVK